MPDHTNVDNVKRLLSQIPAACSRNDWVKTLGAIKNALPDGRTIAEDWSRSAPESFNAADFDRTWNSLTVDRGPRGTATLGSLIHIAAHGHSGGTVEHPSSLEDVAVRDMAVVTPEISTFETSRAAGSPPAPSDASNFGLQGEAPPTNPDTPNPRGKITERYKILDWDGTHIATHLRYEDGGRPWVGADNGRAVKKTDAPYFNCDRLIQALANKREFFIVMVEGEKCAKAFQSCFRGQPGDPIVIGTYGSTWRPLDSHIERLVQILDRMDNGDPKDSEIVCWADNDKVGKEHMQGMIALLHENGYPKPVRMITAGHGKGYDVADWIKQGQTPTLEALYGKAKVFQPPQYIVDRHPKYGSGQAPAKPTPPRQHTKPARPAVSPPPPEPSATVQRVPASDQAYGNRVILSSIDLFGVKEAVEGLGIQCRYDTLNEEYEISYRAPQNMPWKVSDKQTDEYIPWMPVDNRAYQRMIASIRAHCVIQSSTDKDGNPSYKRAGFSTAMLKDALDAHIRDNEFNPVVNWLENELPAWDGKSRMTTFLEDMFGCGDGRVPLMYWASVHIPMAVVWRAYHPGFQIPQIVILIGAQGTGKSELIKQLLPEKYRMDWFNDTFQLDWESKYQLEAIRGRILIEIADMAGLRKTENDRLKSFITSSDDGGMRDPYARRPTRSRPRTAIMVGTSDRTDEASLPYDPSGYRRFVPVVFKHGCDVQAYMQEHRDQIWAEALHYYHQGLNPNDKDDFTKQLQAEATKEHAPVNEIIESKVMDLPQMIIDQFNIQSLAPGSAIKLYDIMKAMGIDERGMSSVGAQRRIASDLRKAGWTQAKNTRQTNVLRPGPRKVGNWWLAPESTE